MSTFVSSPSQINASRNQQMAISIDKIDQDPSDNTQYRLTRLLQTTIELEPLFELFFGQVQHLIKLSHCQFKNDERGILIKLGTSGSHTCNYTLSIQQHGLGSIGFSRKQRFSEDELRQLEILLGTLVYPLRNALNYYDAIHQALCDPLTGLGNRGALENALEYQWQMAQRYAQDLGVLMIDIDYFKSINDNYGHNAGDSVLKSVADTIQSTTRQTDLSFRYGGEEFIVLLNKTTPLGSAIIAERIRENIESLTLTAPNNKAIKVSASIGGAHLKSGMDKHSLVKEADAALYSAKQAGRNRVTFDMDILRNQHTGHLSA